MHNNPSYNVKLITLDAEWIKQQSASIIVKTKVYSNQNNKSHDNRKRNQEN